MGVARAMPPWLQRQGSIEEKKKRLPKLGMLLLNEDVVPYDLIC